MKPPIKDTLKEDKPPNKGQTESTLVYILYRKSTLKEDTLSIKDKTAGPERCPLLRGSTGLAMYSEHLGIFLIDLRGYPLL